MLIYEVISKSYNGHHIFFRTKDKLKAESFCGVYNKYHNNIFDEGATINVVDTARIEQQTDKFLQQFRFMTEVQILDEKIVSCRPVFVDDSRIKLNDAVSSLSEGVKLFFDITEDVTEDKIWARYEELKSNDKENNSGIADNSGTAD